MPTIPVSCNGNIIKSVNDFEYLGVKLDLCPTFNNNVNYLNGKSIGKIKNLNRLNPILPNNLKMTLYKTLIIPHSHTMRWSMTASV